MQRSKVEDLTVQRYPTRRELGEDAARDAVAYLGELLRQQQTARVIFAAAPSQSEFLETLCALPGVDWGRVEAFHMDEYAGLSGDDPRSFGSFLRTRVFDRLPFRAVHYLNGMAPDLEAECQRYGALLSAAPIDAVFMGIGENGHIAFNDPPVADFNDPAAVKLVELDQICRLQQVHDGCFPSLDEVPVRAVTLTVPTLFSGRRLFCMVPAATKAKAVRDTLQGPVSERCPASILRRHPDAVLYIDADSGSLLESGGQS